MKRCFGENYHGHHQGEQNFSLQCASVASYCAQFFHFFTLMMAAIFPLETSVITTATRHRIPEDTILHSHRRENVKSYIALTGWAL
jgi:hypothetical protein